MFWKVFDFQIHMENKSIMRDMKNQSPFEYDGGAVYHLYI